MYYINYFFIMSIFGHLMESILYPNINSGILFGYWTPIYGIGSVIILLIYKCVSQTKYKNYKKVFFVFVSSAIILSLIEMIGGYLIKAIFNKEMWNYTDHILNIGKYASLQMALIWGLSGLALIYFFKPIVDKLATKTPKFIGYVCITLFIIDLIATSVLKI